MTTKHDLDDLGYGFVPAHSLPEGKDEYYLRDLQNGGGPYRNLTRQEVTRLEANANWAERWNDVRVADGFDTDLVQGSRFYGLVRIGRLQRHYLAFHDLKVPVGIYDSTVISCDLGSNVSIMKVGYLSHYIIGDETIIAQTDEVACTNHSKFGNGTLKDGEPEDVRIWLELGNENGGRRVLPFNGMTSADAYLWYKFRDDVPLMQRFKKMTDRLVDPARGYYGTIGTGNVIKSCRIIKDVCIGDHAYIKGANKLKNLTINSTLDEPSQIGEGVELVNGIIESGCTIFYGVKAVRFYLAAHTALKYGARLINSYLGENSTISCCEVLNSLIFPAHEQHHNNSFLCAALLQGQTNMAAGATLGSNHNSRSNDGEISAGRGFWPGLCVSIKHNCRFASYTLLAKADYPSELDIPLPFALVSRDETRNQLVILPAYWFRHNMYALARNSWKFKARDRRLVKKIHLETDYLAPDTAEEMFAALEFLERHVGRERMASPQGNEPFLLAPGLVERSKQPVQLHKARQGYDTYRDMLHLYAVKTMLAWQSSRQASLADLIRQFSDARRERWVNVGGQPMPSARLEQLKADIRSEDLASWEAVHSRYRLYAEHYPLDKTTHAVASLCSLHAIDVSRLTDDRWSGFVDDAVRISSMVTNAVRESRAKDYSEPFRSITFDSPEEMKSVVGSLEDNDFVQRTEQEARDFELLARRVAHARARRE